jgi:hypothetical protein
MIFICGYVKWAVEPNPLFLQLVKHHHDMEMYGGVEA